MRSVDLTEDQSDWGKFGYERGQIEMTISRKGAKAQRRSSIPVLSLPLCAFAGNNYQFALRFSILTEH